jgi:hypothetical protein
MGIQDAKVVLVFAGVRVAAESFGASYQAYVMGFALQNQFPKRLAGQVILDGQVYLLSIVDHGMRHLRSEAGL